MAWKVSANQRKQDVMEQSSDRTIGGVGRLRKKLYLERLVVGARGSLKRSLKAQIVDFSTGNKCNEAALNMDGYEMYKKARPCAIFEASVTCAAERCCLELNLAEESQSESSCFEQKIAATTRFLF